VGREAELAEPPKAASVLPRAQYHQAMAVQVGVRELRDRLSSYLERVRAGEQIEITDRGRPIAMPGRGRPASISRRCAASGCDQLVPIPTRRTLRSICSPQCQ
jgi:antitoxin (DNA-binding transcriptional repressor) of toxin-antitoxin stability system